jgi:hypothetical protein
MRPRESRLMRWRNSIYVDNLVDLVCPTGATGVMALPGKTADVANCAWPHLQTRIREFFSRNRKSYQEVKRNSETGRASKHRA